MKLWLIAVACLSGAGLIAWGSARLGLRWPLLVLALLLAAIALQLRAATLGRGGMHDLGALIAQAMTVSPALIGVATGLALAALQGRGARWRGLPGVATALALLTAAGAAVTTFLV